jgi:hypothetical protein
VTHPALRALRGRRGVHHDSPSASLLSALGVARTPLFLSDALTIAASGEREAPGGGGGGAGGKGAHGAAAMAALGGGGADGRSGKPPAHRELSSSDLDAVRRGREAAAAAEAASATSDMGGARGPGAGRARSVSGSSVEGGGGGSSSVAGGAAASHAAAGAGADAPKEWHRAHEGAALAVSLTGRDRPLAPPRVSAAGMWQVSAGGGG